MKPSLREEQGSARRTGVLELLLFAILVLGLPLLFGTAAKIFNDGDTGWHLAAGNWIIEHRQVPRVDPFSFTMAGRPWTAHEWLADIFLAGAFRAAGYAGLAALVTAALIMLHLLVYRAASTRVGPEVSFFTFIGLVLVLAPFILARPHLLVWPLMALWTSLLLDAADQKKPPPWWLPLLMILWVNLHGSFPLALVIYGAIALDAWLAGSSAGMKRWLLVGLACAGATLANANGLSALVFPFTVARMDTLHLILEWQPSSFERTPFFFLVLAGLIGALLVMRARISPARLMLLGFLLAMALLQVRHQSWFVIAAALIVPRALASRSADMARAKRAPVPPRIAVPAALSCAALVLLLPIGPNEGPSYPIRLIAAIPASLRNQPVFNQYSFGGPLILAGIRPYIDGRADMYGDAFFADYDRIERGDMDRFARAVDRYGIRWTMVQQSNRRFVKALDASPQWRRVAWDKVGVIHVRTGAAAR